MPKPKANWFARLQDTVLSFIDDTLFISGGGGEQSRARHFIHFWVLTGKSFVRNRGLLRATALSYTTMLALVPVLAVGLAVSTSMLKGEGGKEAIREFVAKLVDQVAPQLGLLPRDASGPVTVAAEDIKDLPGFVAELRQGTNLVAQFLWEQLSEPGRQRLVEPNDGLVEKKDLKALLAEELNRIVHGELLYNEQRFAGVTLSPGTRTLLATDPQGEQRAQINRAFLEEAFPSHVEKSAGADARMLVKDRIQAFIANVNSGALGITGTIGLIFIAVGLLTNIEATFNDIWGVKRGRNWLTRAEHYTAILFWGPILLVFGMGLSVSASVHKTQRFIHEGLPVIGDWVIVGMGVLAPFLLTMVFFALLYLMIPNTRVDWSAALVGALVACLLWHLNNWVNVTFASRVVTASKIYGPLSAIPVFLVGLYFSWLILLFGAQVAYTYQYRRAYLQERQAETVNQRGREFVAMRMAACIAERFHEGQPSLTSAEIAEALGVPVRLIHQVGEALLVSGLMTRVAGEEIAYSPGRPLDRISCHDVLLAMRAGQGQELATLDGPARSVVRSEYERIEESERRVASAVSLLNVIQRMPARVELLPAGETVGNTVEPEPRESKTTEPAPMTAASVVDQPVAATEPDQPSASVGGQSFPL